MASSIWRGLLRTTSEALRLNADPLAVASNASASAQDRFTRGLRRDADGRLMVNVNAALTKVLSFTETTGAGTTYTGTASLPAGATLLDIVVDGIALWTAGTSATMIVGDATDPDGYYAAVNMKATDLLAGESLSFGNAGGKAGAYIANSQVSPRYSAAARDIVAVVTVAGTVGTAGRTRMTVIYSAPLAADVVAATKA